jgi:hypothetical protein
LIVFAKSISISGGITSVGGNGAGDASNAGGGGGSGGSIMLACGTATLGTTLAVATLGSGGAGQGAGGNGANGRIAVHHSGTVTGTTSPTFDDTSEPTLVESGGGGFFQFM